MRAALTGAAFLLIALSGCGPKPVDRLAGTWTSGPGTTVTLDRSGQLTAEGPGTLPDFVDASSTDGQKWSVDGRTLEITKAGKAASYTYRLADGDRTLTVTAPSGARSWTLYRAASASR